MAATYTPIASATLGANASSVTFSSIPQTYTDLIIVVQTANTGSVANTLALRFNSDTGNNYSYTRIYADGSTVASDRETNISYLGIGILSNAAITSAGLTTINVMNYANTTTNKSTVSRSSDVSSNYVALFTSLWRSTAAITSITVLPSSDSLRSGSTFNLYGILGANA